jgi:hypothetical protein
LSGEKVAKGRIVAVSARAQMWRDRTKEDHQAWRDSDASKGLNCAGETKLDSPSRYKYAGGETYTVTRARVTCRRGWITVGKCTEVVDADGIHWFVKRDNLFVVK